MRGVGLNIRISTNLLELIVQAQRLELPFFQCFLTFQENGKYIRYTHEELRQFLVQRSTMPLYAHGSYRINLASSDYYYDSCYFLQKELELAQSLGCAALVVHPGAVNAFQDRQSGIEHVAKKINAVVKKEEYPTILLENVAFGQRTIGGDIHDLAAIRSKLDKPEKVQFCIDTAHAYSYGYDIADSDKQTAFIDLIEKILGIESVALIHLNDTRELLGMQRDRHDVPGQGNIGIAALQRFVLDPRLIAIPLLLELPVLPEESVREIIESIKRWR